MHTENDFLTQYFKLVNKLKLQIPFRSELHVLFKVFAAPFQNTGSFYQWPLIGPGIFPI